MTFSICRLFLMQTVTNNRGKWTVKKKGEKFLRHLRETLRAFTEWRLQLLCFRYNFVRNFCIHLPHEKFFIVNASFHLLIIGFKKCENVYFSLLIRMYQCLRNVSVLVSKKYYTFCHNKKKAIWKKWKFYIHRYIFLLLNENIYFDGKKMKKTAQKFIKAHSIDKVSKMLHINFNVL